MKETNKENNNFLFKDIKEYNKFLLTIICCLILLTTSIVSYMITNSYAKWSSGNTSGNTIKASINNSMTATEFATAKVGTDGLELVTHTIDSTLLVDSNFATEYRFRGGDSVVKNYVSFNNETWRIIGILPTEDTSGNVEYRFKIIRDESIGDMNWNENGTGTNNWTKASLNTYLNGDYYNSLSTDAQSMIGTAKYYLGGYNTASITSDVMWQYERKSSGSTYYYGTNPVVQSDASKEIALMYASDYGYAAPTTCTNTLNNYDTDACRTTNNWLDKSQYEWLLPQDSSDSDLAFYVISSGCVYNDRNVNSVQLAARPVLYLSSSVKITGGEGTSSSPYQLSL